jgi:hypothetical protein
MIQYIYGYPVYKFSIEDPSKSISEVQKCIDGTKEVNPSDEWNAECLTTSSHGRGCNTNDEKYEFKYIFQELYKHSKIFLNELNMDINLTVNVCGNSSCNDTCNDTWINIYKKGHYQGPHWHVIGDEDEEPEYQGHPQNLFSFTYFMKYDEEKDAKFKFIDPSPGPVIFEEWKNKVPCFKGSFIPDVKQGDVIIFPCFMVHEVSKQDYDGPRITFSGNLYKEL